MDRISKHNHSFCRVCGTAVSRRTSRLYIGAFICFGDAELTEACARELLRLVPAGSYDYLFTATTIRLS